MTCTKCGKKAECLITNIESGNNECQRCCMGDDCMMLRRVTIETVQGPEVSFVHALNNIDAFKQVLTRRGKRPYQLLIATPMPN